MTTVFLPLSVLLPPSSLLLVSVPCSNTASVLRSLSSSLPMAFLTLAFDLLKIPESALLTPTNTLNSVCVCGSVLARLNEE